MAVAPDYNDPEYLTNKYGNSYTPTGNEYNKPKDLGDGVKKISPTTYQVGGYLVVGQYRNDPLFGNQVSIIDVNTKKVILDPDLIGKFNNAFDDLHSGSKAAEVVNELKTEGVTVTGGPTATTPSTVAPATTTTTVKPDDDPTTTIKGKDNGTSIDLRTGVVYKIGHEGDDFGGFKNASEWLSNQTNEKVKSDYRAWVAGQDTADSTTTAFGLPFTSKALQGVIEAITKPPKPDPTPSVGATLTGTNPDGTAYLYTTPDDRKLAQDIKTGHVSLEGHSNDKYSGFATQLDEFNAQSQETQSAIRAAVAHNAPLTELKPADVAIWEKYRDGTGNGGGVVKVEGDVVTITSNGTPTRYNKSVLDRIPQTSTGTDTADLQAYKNFVSGLGKELNGSKNGTGYKVEAHGGTVTITDNHGGTDTYSQAALDKEIKAAVERVNGLNKATTTDAPPVGDTYATDDPSFSKATTAPAGGDTPGVESDEHGAIFKDGKKPEYGKEFIRDGKQYVVDYDGAATLKSAFNYNPVFAQPGASTGTGGSQGGAGSTTSSTPVINANTPVSPQEQALRNVMANPAQADALSNALASVGAGSAIGQQLADAMPNAPAVIKAHDTPGITSDNPGGTILKDGKKPEYGKEFIQNGKQYVVDYDGAATLKSAFVPNPALLPGGSPAVTSNPTPAPTTPPIGGGAVSANSAPTYDASNYWQSPAYQALPEANQDAIAQAMSSLGF